MTTARPVDTRPLDAQSVAELSERLMIEYKADLPAATVLTVVHEAHSDLTGQVPATALAELLERLVRYRLDRLMAAAGH